MWAAIIDDNTLYLTAEFKKCFDKTGRRRKLRKTISQNINNNSRAEHEVKTRRQNRTCQKNTSRYESSQAKGTKVMRAKEREEK